MQQTPIQEVIKKLQDNKDIFPTAFAVVIKWATELFPTEQQYIQQHAEGFAEWVVENGWRKFERTNVWHNSFDFEQPEKFTTSELYTKYINSLTT